MREQYHSVAAGTKSFCSLENAKPKLKLIKNLRRLLLRQSLLANTFVGGSLFFTLKSVPLF
jgi:hypothetical protein